MNIVKMIFRRGDTRTTTHSDNVADSTPANLPINRPRDRGLHLPLQSSLLMLTAERIDRVERELIRRLSGNFEIDPVTHGLLTELRIATNRLRGQISDLERLEGWSLETSPLAPGRN